MPIFLTVAFIILRAVLILKRRIGLSSGGEKYGSPKEAGKSGGLDVEAAGRHEEVQKERKKERNWTLREETALARSKRAHQNWHCFLDRKYPLFYTTATMTRPCISNIITGGVLSRKGVGIA